MYLVELKPGKEELYRTGDDLALAIRDGEVDARSRIYHRATAKWISITLHPQYKAIVAGQRDEPMARPARKAWSLFPAGLTGQSAEMSSSEAEPANGSIRHRWKRPIGFGVSGLFLLLGIQLTFSGSRPTGEPAAKAESGIGTPGPDLDQPTTIQPVTTESGSNTITLPDPDEEAPPAPALPRAPRLRSKALRSALRGGSITKPAKASPIAALLNGYEAASDEASTKLAAGMRVARLNRLFARGRLNPGGGVTETRRSLAGAANFIRIYRQHQAAVERAYQDSVTRLSNLPGWTPEDAGQWNSRLQRKETPTLELISGSLLAAIDSVLGVLDAQAGAYKVRGTAIAFEDPAAGQAYGALRRRIKEQIDAAVAGGGATSLGPTSMLLQAIGTSALPRET